MDEGYEGPGSTPARAPMGVARRAEWLSASRVEVLTARIVEHLVGNVAVCATLPDEELRGDVTDVVRACVRLGVAAVGGTHAHGEWEGIRRAGALWAQEGIPLDSIHHAIHEGLKVALDQLGTTFAEADPRIQGRIGGRLFHVMGEVDATVARAYTAELSTLVGRHRASKQSLMTALLSGHLTAAIATECGVAVADSYFLLAVCIASRPSGRPQSTTSKSREDDRTHGSLRDMLDDRCEGALSLFNGNRGTLLIPTQFGDQELDALVVDLGNAIGSPLIAVAIPTSTQLIPAVRDQARELVAIALRARRGPGLYRLKDLVVEYQLARSGRVRVNLPALLDPLDDHPELLETLVVLARHDFNRKRASRALHVHVNTINYRAGRIADLVGFHPADSRGAWYLQSVLIARGVV